MNIIESSSEKKQIHVLYIEDNPMDILLFQRYFAKIAQEDKIDIFHLEIVDRLSKALELLSQGDIDLILTDLKLPDASELEAVTELHRQFPMIPIIAVTNTYNKSMGLEAVRAGAQDYLLKDELNSYLLNHSIRYAIERKRLEKMKDKFLTTISHELLTPLTIMKGGLSILNKEGAESVTSKQKEILGLFSRSIDRLMLIVKDILDFSRLESRRVNINCHIINIKPLIQEVINGLHSQLEEKNIIIENNISELPHVFADPNLIIQVLTNILSNAQRYAKTKITFSSQSTDQFVCICIKDDGPGIALKNQKKLFTEFEQIHRSEDQGYQGTGLGLAICKEIITLHKGKIWVESDEGKGAQFCFALPSVR